jgi:hypothetical protein
MKTTRRTIVTLIALTIGSPLVHANSSNGIYGVKSIECSEYFRGNRPFKFKLNIRYNVKNENGGKSDYADVYSKLRGKRNYKPIEKSNGHYLGASVEFFDYDSFTDQNSLRVSLDGVSNEYLSLSLDNQDRLTDSSGNFTGKQELLGSYRLSFFPEDDERYKALFPVKEKDVKCKLTW